MLLPAQPSPEGEVEQAGAALSPVPAAVLIFRKMERDLLRQNAALSSSHGWPRGHGKIDRLVISASLTMTRSARQLKVARDLLLSEPEFDLEHAVRLVGEEVASSWQRSRRYGLDPGASPVLPQPEPYRAPPRLLAAAIPVLEELQPQLDGTVIVLADRSSRIAWRGSSDPSLIDLLSEITPWEEGTSLAEEFLGTNGTGTGVEVRGPLVVPGSAHYMEVCQGVTATSMSVTDPITGRLEAVVNLTRPRGGACEALLPLAVATARRIEARLWGASSTAERALLEAFMRISATPAEAVACLSETILITNPQAAELLDPADHATLWEWARRCVGSRKPVSDTIPLGGARTVTARCSPVEDGSEVVGVVIAMQVGAKERAASTNPAEAWNGNGATIWTALLERACESALESDRILLRGEHGVGKATLAEQVYSRLAGARPVTTIDCGLDQGREHDRFLADLTAALDRATGSVILRHIDLLTPQSASLVARSLRASRRRVLLTCSADESAQAGLIPLLNLVELEIEVPPLRERTYDIPALVAALMRKLSKGPIVPRCSSEVLASLMRLDWPGNVAELQRVLKSALVGSRGLDVNLGDLPPRYRSSGRLLRTMGGMERVQRDAILAALRRSGWNHAAAAEDLGISRATIYRKVKQMGISAPGGSPSAAG